jgi:hypothetical protein
MVTAYFTQHSGYSAAPNPLADIGHIPPMHHDIQRHPHPPQVQQRPPKKKSPEKDHRQPGEPEHKVDDYA